MGHDDLALVLAWRNHPDVRRYMYTQHEITLAEHQRWFERCLPDPKKHLLVFEANHQPLGFVNFNETGSGGIADWGFYAAPDAPKGSGRQLGRAALSYAFAQLKLHKISGQALACNQRSIQLHQFLGFQQEGILRDQHFDGERYHNAICFGLFGHEWQTNS
ncbi:MAG: UDP-4-amino-4,6-dideoxy-N-acetyl-beta-L-altrosamine N-acetyltransferase [Burkholderiales bacterium PBB3]|nr:MAG: UDP-4-amino-4,6-dideoxy-N-acetyl-beta-L-altrosamine N-acetyltransferase [Burkholderiales bacterium PBB3]